MTLNPEIWGPYYWFFLETMALTYPLHPNDVSKKKYYDFIQNLPLFIPNPEIGNNFSKLIDTFPVTPYLDSRLSFMKWINFIHNKINKQLDKPVINIYDSLENYYKHYKPKKPEKKSKKELYYKIIIGVLVVWIIYLYNINEN
jgi:hypothetical protein